RRRPGGLAGRVDDQELVPGDHDGLHQREQHEGDERQHERELDRRLAGVAAARVRVPAAHGCCNFSITDSNMSVNAWVWMAQGVRAMAMWPAARTRRAYWAVGGPRASWGAARRATPRARTRSWMGTRWRMGGTSVSGNTEGSGRGRRRRRCGR